MKATTTLHARVGFHVATPARVSYVTSICLCAFILNGIPDFASFIFPMISSMYELCKVILV